MVMVEVNSNVILVEPMSSRRDKKMQHTYLSLLKHVKAAGIEPKRHFLDDQCSNSLKELIHKTCKLKLVPPY